MDDFTIIIPFFNGHATIGQLLKDIDDSVPGTQVLIINDRSDTGYTAPYQLQNIKTIDLENKGYFSGAVNTGIKACNNDVLVLNQDARLQGAGWAELLWKESDNYAMIGERIYGNHPAWPDGYIQGTFMWIRRDAIDHIGYLDAELYPLWGATCEYQLRLHRAGYSTLGLKTIPDFRHTRNGRFGHAINTMLKRNPNRRGWFIRTPPEISVIAPCYNYGRYIPDMLGSLLGGKTSMGELRPQSMQSFEVIIVDDASTDDTQEICKGLADNKKAIRYIRLKHNSGTAAAINAGIRASYGNVITVLSADDMRESNSLKRLYQALSHNLHSLIYDDIRCFGNGEYLDELKIAVSDYDFNQLLYKNHVHAGIMFPKHAWEEVGGYPEIFKDGREDWAMNVALGINGYCGVHIKEQGYLYRRENQNRSLTNTNPRRHEYFLAKLMSLFPQIYKGDRPIMCCGKRTSKVSKGTRSYTAAIAMDAGSMVLEYIGTSQGTQTFYGPGTGSQYVAGLSRPLITADPKDAVTGNARKPGLLEIREAGKNIFRVYKPPKQTPIKPATPPKETPAEPEAPLQEEHEESQQEELPQEKLPQSVTTLSLPQIQKLFIDADTAKAWLQEELEGKKRKTVIAYLKAFEG